MSSLNGYTGWNKAGYEMCDGYKDKQFKTHVRYDIQKKIFEVSVEVTTFKTGLFGRNRTVNNTLYYRLSTGVELRDCTVPESVSKFVVLGVDKYLKAGLSACQSQFKPRSLSVNLKANQVLDVSISRDKLTGRNKIAGADWSMQFNPRGEETIYAIVWGKNGSRSYCLNLENGGLAISNSPTGITANDISDIHTVSSILIEDMAEQIQTAINLQFKN